MKKRNLNSLKLRKERISNFEHPQIVGGHKTQKWCYYSIKTHCKTECETYDCASSPLYDCTVTYEACVTEPRFCGRF
jgi:hypothetical protein